MLLNSTNIIISKNILLSSINFNQIIKRFYPGNLNKIINKSVILFSRMHSYKLYQRKLMEVATLNSTYHNILYVTKKGYISNDFQLLSKTFDFMPEYPAIVNNVSGIYQPSPTLLNAADLKTVLFGIHIKFIYTFFSKYLTDINDVANRIELFIKKDIITESVYYYPLMQHLLVNTLQNFKFPPEVLTKISPQIDYSQFMDNYVQGLTILETIVFKETHEHFILKNQAFLKITAQNADKLKDTTTEDAKACYAQMKQPFGDFQIKIRHIIENYYKSFCKDSKLFGDPQKTLPLCRGYLSLATNINEDFLIKRYKSDLGGILSQKKDLTLSTRKALEQTQGEFDILIKNKILKPKEKYEILREICDKIDLNPKIQNFSFSCIKVPERCYSFESWFSNLNIENNIELNFIKENMKVELLLPKQGQTAHVLIWHESILSIIKAMPRDIREDLLENYNRFKEIESGL